MTEYVLPPSLRVSGAQWGVRGSAAAFSSPFTGATRTYSRGGDLWAAELSIDNASNQASFAERAYYAGLLAAIKSKANRVWMSPPGYVRRGSFPATELFTNADFAQGTTGWSAYTSDYSRVVSGGVYRATGTGSSGDGGSAVGGSSYPAFQANSNKTANFPHVIRAVLRPFGPVAPTALRIYDNDVSVAAYGTMPAGGIGYQAASMVPSTIVQSYGVQEGVTRPAGNGIDIEFISYSRCFQIDNSPNVFANSLISAGGWTNGNSSVTGSYYTAPDGTTTGARLIEATDVSQSHYIYREATRTNDYNDWFACGFFRVGQSGSRSRVYVSVRDTLSGTHGASAIFNLSNGTISTAANSFGSALGARAYIRSMGYNSWYFCAIGCRMPNSGTTVGAFACPANNSDAPTYNGDGSSDIGVWHFGLANSGVPFNPGVTTGTAVASGVTQSGSALRVKGLPVSTSGLLLPGDFVQIGNQLDQVVAPLDSDAAGLGYLQLSRPQRTAPADNAAVIVEKPMGRFLFAENDIGYSLRPGQLSDYTIPLIEDVA